MKSRISRREALKLGLFSLGGFASRVSGVSTPWHHDLAYSLFLGRVAFSAVNVYPQPRSDLERVAKLNRDELVSILEEVTGPNGPKHNPLWYKISSGYIFSGGIQRVKINPPNPPLAMIPETGILCEVSVPYTRSFFYSRSTGWRPLYRLYFESVHWVYEIETGPDGSPWYQIQENYPDYTYFAPSADLRPIPYAEYTAIARSVAPEEKHIEISLSEQTLTALERDVPVLRAAVSTGIPSPAHLPEGEIPTDTPKGSFRIQTKIPSRHMGDGRLTSDFYAYELPGVPWTMLFHKDGYALHGTYWHNNFGTRMSHGCVNMRNGDAKWLFRWTDPAFEPGEWFKRESGTLIVIQ